ncbi:MAG: DUF6531 domain-containing protein [Oscillospiraceae bacterium]|nr:DUF6531 domain-containing protein [Oscillospiraceae bacterium]
MDKLEINIPKLQDTVAEYGKMVTDAKEIGKSISETNKKLTSTGIWQGDGANAYNGKSGQWNKNYKAHENTAAKMKDATKTVLSQAEDLNRQALGFAGIVGGSSGGGPKNILTYDPNAKTGAVGACEKAIAQIDSQLAQVKKAENSLAGISGLRVSTDLSAYRKALNDRKNKLNKLRQAIMKYASSAEALVSTATRVFGGISLPEGAIATLKSWGITHEDICVMLNGLNMGCCQYGGDPVNMATGNFIYEKEYLKIKGLFPLSFKMFYNALERRVGTLGTGWVHNFAVCLKKDKNSIALYLEDGRQEIFYDNGNGAYSQSFNKHDILRKTTKGFVYQNAKQISYYFDEEGNNIKVEDQNGNYAILAYDQGRLTRVENNSGNSLDYQYSPDGKLVQVSDNTGRRVDLAYEDGRVCMVAGEEGQEQRYQYNEKGKISSIFNPLGVNTLENEYDRDNRITKQTFPDGGVIQYDYRDEDKELLVTEQNGNEVAYSRDDRMRTTAVVYADGAERYAYNEQNQRVWQIDKNGNETRYEYDDQGNVSQVTNALGEAVCAQYNEMNKPTKVSLCGIERMAGKYDAHGNLLKMSDALGRTRSFSYNENGRPTRLTQPDGSSIELSYDERGNIVRVIDQNGSQTQYEYDKNNRVITTVDPNGNRTYFSYNRRNEMIKVVNAEGRERAYEYNQAGKLTKATDFDGSVSRYEYNALNKPTRFVDPSGHETRLEYDIMWNVSKQINANGAEMCFDYDALHRLIKVTNAMGHSVQYAYDPNGNRTAVIDPQGGQVHLSYDALNRVVGVAEADGAKTSVIYNELGQVTAVIDAMGNVRTFTYDAAGQKTEETDPLGNKTTYTYTNLGKIASITDPIGRVTVFEYESGGLLSREVYPDGRWIRYEYDAAKNLVAKQDQSGYTLNYAYDCLNRIIKISSNQGQEKCYTYDATGHVTSMTDANGSTTHYAYSPAGKLIRVIDALGNKSEYEYDGMGELIQVKQFEGIDGDLSEALSLNENNTRMTAYHRNPLGQIEYIEDALGQKESYDYDAFSRVTGKTDKDGYLTQYAYGHNGQLEHIQYADGRSVRLSYNPLRQLTEIQDWLGMTSIETDPLGRATKVRDHNGKEVQHLYGAGGERLETVYPDGKKAEYLYDGTLRLSQLSDGENIVSYAYDENGRLGEKRFSNGMLTRYDYNNMGLLSSLTHSDHEGVLDQYTYYYDLMGNKTGIDKFRRGLEADSGQFGYGYDALGRLADVSKDGTLLRTYAYDPFGNRTRMAEGGGQTSYSFNALNQLLRVEAADLTREYQYDARGNVTGVLENGLTKHTYEFGALNRLEKAANTDGQVSLYQYNGFGQRVGKQIPGGLDPTQDISYVLDLNKQYHNLLQTYDGGKTKTYLWDFNVVAESGDEGDRFYLQDELGSPLRFAGVDGKLVDSYAYDEFGNDLTGNQSVAQPFGYTGYRYDNLAETYFAQAREYMPDVGRFVSEDMVHSDVNYYIYCNGNPLRFIDRNGLWKEDVHNGFNNTDKYGTYYWAKGIGFSQDFSQQLAYYNAATDKNLGTNPFPIVGDQSYHFNTTPFYSVNQIDTRQQHADENLQIAIELWNQGREDEALQVLGMGLHALQDIEAHGNADVDIIAVLGFSPIAYLLYGTRVYSHVTLANIDDTKYDWTNEGRTSVKLSETHQRLRDTEKVTKEYLTEFAAATGIELSPEFQHTGCSGRSHSGSGGRWKQAFLSRL